MSHPVNDEILENLYEQVKEEFPNAHPVFIIAEVQKRFEEMSTWTYQNFLSGYLITIDRGILL